MGHFSNKIEYCFEMNKIHCMALFSCTIFGSAPDKSGAFSLI
jgi:hypothetical protein